VESFLWANVKLQLESGVTVLSRDPAAVLSRAPHWAGQPALSFCVGDVRSFSFPSGPFSHVIHAATEASPQVMTEDPLQVFDVNMAGTRRVLEFAASCGARKFLLTSTGAVYGRQPPDLALLPESFGGAPDPTDVPSPYAAAAEAKRAAETLGALYWKQHGVETHIARLFTFVGPRLPLDGKFAIGNFIRDALRGGPIVVRGDGTPCRSYLYTADLAIWLWTILFRGQPCRPYNVGSESAITIARLAQTVATVLRRPSEVQIAQAADPRKPPERYVPATQRARTELGVAETIGLREAIRRTVLWHDPHASLKELSDEEAQ
jgi:dTDP-glucose 4,6-dehydratase